jgi:putative membrane protein
MIAPCGAHRARSVLSAGASMNRQPSLVSFLVFWGVNTLSRWVASNLVSGVTFRDRGALLLSGLLLGILNTFVRPVLVLLTFPLTLVTLGLFLLVVNALVLMLVAWLVPGFDLRGFGTGFVAALLVSVVSWIVNALVGRRGSP